MAKDLTKGSVLKAISAFSLPYLLAYFLQTFYGTVDLFIVGLFSTTASITAVATGSQVMHMLTVVIVGLAMGSTVMIAQTVGSNDPKNRSTYIGNTATLFLLFSLALTVILLFLTNPIISLMQVPFEAVEGTYYYLLVCFAGIPFITAYNVIAAIFRGLGDTKTPLYFVAIACLINIGLDVLFVGAFNWGAAGAAIATVISQALSVCIALIVIAKKSLLPSLKRSDFRPQKQLMKNILKVGTPLSLQDGFIQVAFLCITVFANMRGLDDAAAVGIVEKIICLLFLVPSSLLSTMSAVGAQNVGAGNHARVNKTFAYCMAMVIVYGFGIAIIVQFCAANIIALFSPDPHVITLGTQYLQGYVWDTGIAGIHFIFSGYFTAYGWSIVSFIHNSISIVCARVPLSYFASVMFLDTLWPMGFAVPVGSSLSVFICIGIYIWLRRHPEKLGITS
ncbi:MAG: MATE family efflux transporter [Anaerotardibacter sp.]